MIEILTVSIGALIATGILMVFGIVWPVEPVEESRPMPKVPSRVMEEVE